MRDEVFACTKLEATPAQIIEWVVMQWLVETTFEEAREHLWLETRAPMERLGDRARDALPAGPVFAGGVAHRALATRWQAAGADGGLV